MFHQPEKPLTTRLLWRPTIYFTPEVVQQMAFIVQNANIEVGWLGTVKLLEDNNLLVDHIYIPKQDANSATCEINDEGAIGYAQELIDLGMEDRLGDVRFWAHTHVNMSVGASSQDDTQFLKLTEQAADFWLRLIVNKHGDWNLSLIYPHLGIQLENLSWQYYLADSLSDSTKQSLLEAIETRVTRKAYRRLKWSRGHGYAYPLGSIAEDDAGRLMTDEDTQEIAPFTKEQLSYIFGGEVE